MRIRLVAVIGGLLMLAAVAAPLEAQRRGGSRGDSRDRERLEQRVRAQMARMMEERLGLTADEAERLGEIVQEFRAQRFELVREERATRRRVEALMLEGTDDDAEALELLTRLAELRAREVELFTEEQQSLLEVLTPTELLEYQSLRDQLGRRIRSLSRGSNGGRGGSEPGRRGGRRGPGGWDFAGVPSAGAPLARSPGLGV